MQSMTNERLLESIDRMISPEDLSMIVNKLVAKIDNGAYTTIDKERILGGMLSLISYHAMNILMNRNRGLSFDISMSNEGRGVGRRHLMTLNSKSEDCGEIYKSLIAYIERYDKMHSPLHLQDLLAKHYSIEPKKG